MMLSTTIITYMLKKLNHKCQKWTKTLCRSIRPYIDYECSMMVIFMVNLCSGKGCGSNHLKQAQ
jgi:hypothetical protein